VILGESPASVRQSAGVRLIEVHVSPPAGWAEKTLAGRR
jgi:hypothetical protein